MKLNFTATFKLGATTTVHQMEYDTKDVIKTLERRLTTAFPNATGISIVQDEPAAGGKK